MAKDIVLVTRPEPAAAETAQRLEGLGFAALVDPMLRIVDTGAPLPDGPFDALAFTSVNGVRAFGAHARARSLLAAPAFAVGTRTAREAAALGFATVVDCAGDVSALAGRLAAALPEGARILHAAGEERAGALGDLLLGRALTVTVATLYRAEPAQALAPATGEALSQGGLSAALHYSPRTVRTLLHCVAGAQRQEAFAGLRHLCLSPAVAQPLGATGLACEVAEAPNEEALLALLSRSVRAVRPA